LHERRNHSDNHSVFYNGATYKLNRFRQLDGLRGIAVCLVIVHHWTDFGFELGLGNFGVQLFFVLSGFLITDILLGNRGEIDKGRSASTTIKVFFLKRVFRIWPIMYLTLFGVYISGNRFADRNEMAWHALGCSNLLFFHQGKFTSALAHFWSLAVEQQFYLVWPFIIFFTPKKAIFWVILAMIFVGPLFRLFLFSHGFTNFATYNVLPFANLDSLGFGALIAFCRSVSQFKLLQAEKILLALTLFLLPIAMVYWQSCTRTANLTQTFLALVFSWIICRCVSNTRSFFFRVLESKFIVWLGLISYGVYVYHVFAPRFVGLLLRTVGVSDIFQSGIYLFTASALATLVFANLSWYLIERPILNALRSLIPSKSSSR
jgi:peptidoglycan/LPS O-acetylase OafA/YrhL